MINVNKGDNMKNISPYLILLISYLGFCFYRTPQLPDALIILGLVTLTGVRNYLETISSNKKDVEYIQSIEKRLRTCEDGLSIIKLDETRSPEYADKQPFRW